MANSYLKKFLLSKLLLFITFPLIAIDTLEEDRKIQHQSVIIQTLPVEIMSHILVQTDNFTTIGKLCKTCRYFKALASRQHIWTEVRQHPNLLKILTGSLREELKFSISIFKKKITTLQYHFFAFPGTETIITNNVNNSGKMAGFVNKCPCLWDPIEEKLVPLTNQDNGYTNKALALSSTSPLLAAGFIANCIHYLNIDIPVFWDTSGLHFLKTTNKNIIGRILGTNTTGSFLVGYSDNLPRRQAVEWLNKENTYVYNPLPFREGWKTSKATCVNTLGTKGGKFTLPNGSKHPVLWHSNGKRHPSTEIEEIPLPANSIGGIVKSITDDGIILLEEFYADSLNKYRIIIPGSGDRLLQELLPLLPEGLSINEVLSISPDSTRILIHCKNSGDKLLTYQFGLLASTEELIALKIPFKTLSTYFKKMIIPHVAK